MSSAAAGTEQFDDFWLARSAGTAWRTPVAPSSPYRRPSWRQRRTDCTAGYCGVECNPKTRTCTLLTLSGAWQTGLAPADAEARKEQRCQSHKVTNLPACVPRREDLRQRYLRPMAERPPTTVGGVHHLALISKDADETIKFYQEFLGFPLVELVENRDYKGSNHFFFDIGNNNLLGFFDFPGHEHPAWMETIGGVQHLAIPVSPAQFDAAKNKLDEASVDYLGPDRGVEESMYFRHPNGVGLELYREELRVFHR